MKDLRAFQGYVLMISMGVSGGDLGGVFILYLFVYLLWLLLLVCL